MFRIAKHWVWLILFWFVLAGRVWGVPCDVDTDGDIDLDDLTLIQKAILARAKVSAPSDPRDPDANGLINSIDGRLCALRCTRAKCSTVNQAPFANAGPDQSVRVGELVVLSGAASSDADGDPLRYTWVFSQRPLGSLAQLIEAATVAPRFTADKPGQYLIQLIVSDGRASSVPDTVAVSTENSRPIANAGPDQSVRVGTLVMLNGGHSTDVDGDPLQYTWQLSSVPPGSGATLGNPDRVNPSLLIDLPGRYLIALTVSDGRLSSLPDTVSVSTENSPPVAHPGANQSVPLGAVVTLDGSRSSDVDGNPLTFRWSLLARPAASQAVLSDPSSVRPSFTADFPGTYVAQLIVNDGSVDSTPASVTLTTANAAPLANAGADQTVPLGSLVTLDGGASSDPEGAVLSHTWALIGKPAGSNAALSAGNTANPVFTADLPGSYIAQLIVHDGELASAPDTVTISTANSRPVADAGASQSVTAGSLVQLDGGASRDADGDPLTFAWSLTTLPVGSSAVLTGTDLVSPSFVPDLPGTYIAQLIVSDGRLGSLPATVVITVSAANRKPVAIAEAIPTQTAVGSSVVLKGSASSDPDGDPLTWSWSIALRPAGSNASIVSPTAPETSFVPDVPGTYTIQLIVRDGKVDSVPALVVVQVQAINHPPVITSTAPTSATVGQAYSYPAVAVDPDVGDVLTWSLVTAPSGMTIDPVSGLVAWTPGDAQVGSHPVSARVTDQGGLPATQNFTIVVALPNHPPVISFAGFAPQWTQLAPTGTPPSPRHNYGQNNGYDAINDRLIFFGGSASYFETPPHLNDVWVLENATASRGTPNWVQLSPAGGPPAARILQSVVYDPTANRLIVHGGGTGQVGTILSDAWVLTNANGLGDTPEWIRLPDGEARVGHAAGYDAAANRMIVFGGHTGPVGSDRNDVRVLVDANGIGNPSWIDLTTAGAPPPPRGGVTGAVYDSLSNRLIVFGGRDTRNQMFNDVWVLTNANGLGGASQWLPLGPSGIPPAPRVFHSLTFDSNSNRLLAFGGALPGAIDYVGSNETWFLTHANGLGGAAEWVNLDAGSSLPLARAAAWAGYFGATNRMVVSSGSSGLPDPGLLNDAWVLSNASGNCTAGQPCTFKATATDPDAGDVLTYALDAAPPGMTINPASGAMTWIPAIAQIGNHTVTVRATDRAGLFATQTFTATVAPVAVPNVVGLAPEWAESFITAADLTVGTTTSQGGAITLNFDSLPSRQGWTFGGPGFNAAPYSEEALFRVDGNVLYQNSLGIGGRAAGYAVTSGVDARLPLTVAVRARVTAEEGATAFNHYGFGFEAWTGSSLLGNNLFGVGLGTDAVLVSDDPSNTILPFANTQFHEYLLFARPGVSVSLATDGVLFHSGRPRVYPQVPYFALVLGDLTQGPNARAEVTAYSFTQPRVVGQNPPAGTLVPNKTAVDLTIVDGPATETVPNVIGLSQPVAEAAIVTANLKLGGITSAPHPTIPAGQVSDQSPLPNIHVPKDTPVAIVMSTGPPGPVNQAPSFTSTPVLAALAGSPYAYPVTASDPDAGDTLTFSLPTAPAGMTINATTGLITWTPTLGQVGNTNVTVRVTDSGGMFAEQGFMIAVSPPAPVNLPPSITSTPVTTATADTLYNYDLDATDPNPGDTLTWSLLTAPAGMIIDPATGLIEWTPSAAQAGDHPVEVKVQDAGGLFVTQTYTLTVNAAAVCVPPPPGLVSWWAGEGSALDRAAANDGLAEGGADFAAGLVGQAFRFDGVDDLIRIASSRTVSFGGPFSVEFWFNPTTTIDTSTPNQVLLAKGRYSEGGFNAPVAIQVLGGDGRLLVRMPPAPALISTTDTWPAGTWQHIALSWDGARYRLYINGIEEAGLDNAFSIIDSTDPITLGHADGFAAAGFAGQLDEPTLYNRALTPAEIAALHAAGGLGKCTAGHSRADAGADQTVEVSQTVTLDGSASRAFDAAPLAYQWTLTTRPADSAAVLANPTSVSPSFIADQAGSYTLDLIVSNAGHASAPDSVTITAARVNHPPAITSTPLTAATPGSAYTYPVAASDPDAGDTLAFSLPVAPAGMSINPASGLIQWTPNAGQIGSHNVSVRAQDLGGLFDVQSFLIVVAAAPVPVTVPDVVGQEQTAAQNSLIAASLTVGAVTLASSDTVPAGRVISQNPAAGAVVNSGSAVALVVSSGPPGPALASIRVTPINGLILTGQTQAFAATGILNNGSSLPLTGVAWASSNPAVATIDAAGLVTALAEGNTTISAAKDGVSGNTSFNVAQAVAENTLPVAQISAPADGASIASAVPVVGTASDAHFLKYVIEIAPFETGVFSTLHVGTAPVTNGTLATLDPTTLLNDLYVVRLTVIDKADNRTQTEITVQLTRDKKVGNFTLAFQDVNVPMAGIPISVVRSYDSRDKTRGDFGIGWRLDVQSLRLRVVGIHGQGWEQTRSGGVLNRRYTISPTRVHKVAITLPDGKVEEFDMGVAPSTQQFAPIQVVDAVYTPKAQTRGSLRALGETRLVTFGQTGGFDLLTESGLEIFDPQEFEYTTPEGQVILLSRTAGVQQIRDRSGNTVSFTPGGMTHSAGKSIVFTRDAQSRITTVTDPQGNVQSYAYDINGDLASHTDAEGRRTNYLYNYDHGLIEIQDPRGIRPIRNDYDDAGRLIRTTDAYGKAITYTHDLGANREVITDRLGHATVHVYDDLGNVTQTADALGGVTNRSYDGRGNTLSEQDPLGRTRTTTYDGQDNRLSETDPLGKTTTYTYNGTRQVLTVTDALGRTTSNAYDAAGNLTSTTDPAGQVTSYTYDARGQQLTRTDPLGHFTQYAYDAAGNLVSETDPLGRATSYTYDANGNRLTQTTSRTTAGGPETLLTAFVYDRANRLTQTTHPDGSVTRVAYNAIGKQSITTDPLGRETRFDYDDMGRLIRTTYPNGSSESSTYDAEGRRIGSTDRAGRTTTSTYDAVGRLIETIAPDNSRTSTVYDAAGQVLTSTDARGNVTTYVYDGAGRRTQVIDALGQATTFSYDDLGNQTRVTDANGNAVAFTYDANNRRTRTTYADSTVEQVSYDALGRQTAKTDQAGKTTQYAYDALGRLIRVTDALGQITSYSYDEQGNQLTQTDAEGRTTTFAYDKMGRRTQRTLPLGQSETFTYDTAGNLRTKADFNGRTTSYTYDSVNRLTRRTPDASLGQPPVIFTYTPSGQRASMQDASGSTTYSYDSRDRLLNKATPQGTLSYSYDPAGNLTNIHSNHADGAAMDYTYDQRNRLAVVTDANGTTTYSYDAVGNLAGFLYPNGVQTTYTYNPLNRLTTVTGARGATLASYTYTLGPSGNRTAVTEASGRRVDYTYDDLYRLKSETISADPAGPNGAIAYTYDRVGNRLTRVSTVAVIPDQSFEYDFNDRLGGEGYDNNGNTLTSGGRTFGYDFENHLTSADGGVSFVYNGDGIRVAKTAGGLTTGFLVDDRNPTRYAQVLEEVVGGAVERSYTYGLKLISQKQASGVSFYGYDGHGSVRYLTDAGGSVTDTYAYEAFGNLIAQTGATPNVYLYAGEQKDGDLALYYLRARYFDLRGARFSGRDAWGGKDSSPGTLNQYAYALNDPVNRVDPSGHFSLAQVAVTTAILGTLSVAMASHVRAGSILHGGGKSAWDLSDIVDFRNWIDPNWRSLRKDTPDCDCADVAMDLVIQYAKSKKLPVFFRKSVLGQPYSVDSYIPSRSAGAYELFRRAVLGSINSTAVIDLNTDSKGYLPGNFSSAISGDLMMRRAGTGGSTYGHTRTFLRTLPYHPVSNSVAYIEGTLPPGQFSQDEVENLRLGGIRFQVGSQEDIASYTSLLRWWKDFVFGR